jgi:hypothetical protein
MILLRESYEILSIYLLIMNIYECFLEYLRYILLSLIILFISISLLFYFLSSSSIERSLSIQNKLHKIFVFPQFLELFIIEKVYNI